MVASQRRVWSKFGKNSIMLSRGRAEGVNAGQFERAAARQQEAAYRQSDSGYTEAVGWDYT
jgi:hypothetical protein